MNTYIWEQAPRAAEKGEKPRAMRGHLSRGKREFQVAVASHTRGTQLL